MKSVVVFIENVSLTDSFAQTLTSLLEKKDVLSVMYRLPMVKTEAMPLIGDLRELRLKKAKRQLSEWFERNNIPVQKFNSFVFDERITHDHIRISLNGDQRFLVLYEKGQLNHLKSMLNRVLSDREVDYHELNNSEL